MVDLSKPGLVLFDMDSTLITIECIDEIAALAGRKTEVAAITTAAMEGKLDFAASLRERVRALEGVDRQQFEQLFNPIPFTPGAAELIQWFRQQGWKTALVSGGFTWFAERVKNELQLDIAIANELIWQQDRLTGYVQEPIVDAQYKANMVIELARQFGIEENNTIAVGDGANDALMIEAANLGVAFCAKPALQQLADIVITEHNLMALVEPLKTRGTH
jgi:phosphoserine phosphatase